MGSWQVRTAAASRPAGEPAPVLVWRSPHPLPVTDARPELRVDGRLVAVPTGTADGRGLAVPLDALAGVDTRRLEVWLGADRLDRAGPLAPVPAGRRAGRRRRGSVRRCRCARRRPGRPRPLRRGGRVRLLRRPVALARVPQVDGGARARGAARGRRRRTAGAVPARPALALLPAPRRGGHRLRTSARGSGAARGSGSRSRATSATTTCSGCSPPRATPRCPSRPTRSTPRTSTASTAGPRLARPSCATTSTW